MPREPGVGAELTSPMPGEDQQYNQNDKNLLPPADLSQDEKVHYLIHGVVHILHLCIHKHSLYIFLDKNNVSTLSNIYKFTSFAIWSHFKAILRGSYYRTYFFSTGNPYVRSWRS